jgi:hypothetical protein
LTTSRYPVEAPMALIKPLPPSRTPRDHQAT